MQTFIELVEKVNGAVNGFVWGPVMLTILIGTGLFLSIRTGFAQFRHFGYAIKNTIGGLFGKEQHNKDESGVSPFQAVATAMAGTIGTGSITGIVLTVIVAAVILGGMKRIASINEKLVPFMAVFFVICSLLAIIINFKQVPAAFELIFKEAFNFKAAFGGAAGYGIMTAMRFGFARGVFSNEAGLGSAPMAHAASSAKNPVDQGLWGMFEVFFTTIIICTLSALTILTTGIWKSGGVSGAPLSIASFNAIIPGIGGVIVTLATVFFALSTILGWAYYGEVSAGYLTNNNRKVVVAYRIVYVVMVFVGAVGSLDLIWSISETMNGLMAIPNLIGLIALSGVVAKLTKDYFKSRKKQG